VVAWVPSARVGAGARPAASHPRAPGPAAAGAPGPLGSAASRHRRGRPGRWPPRARAMVRSTPPAPPRDQPGVRVRPRGPHRRPRACAPRGAGRASTAPHGPRRRRSGRTRPRAPAAWWPGREAPRARDRHGHGARVPPRGRPGGRPWGRRPGWDRTPARRVWLDDRAHDDAATAGGVRHATVGHRHAVPGLPRSPAPGLHHRRGPTHRPPLPPRQVRTRHQGWAALAAAPTCRPPAEGPRLERPLDGDVCREAHVRPPGPVGPVGCSNPGRAPAVLHTLAVSPGHAPGCPGPRGLKSARAHAPCPNLLAMCGLTAGQKSSSETIRKLLSIFAEF
jgi:hypothetical protein